MGGAVPPLPQYAFMAWCSVGGSTGTTLPFLPLLLCICVYMCVLIIGMYFRIYVYVCTHLSEYVFMRVVFTDTSESCSNAE